MKVYLDCCCYGRPFDNPEHVSQAIVEAQIVAIRGAVDFCRGMGINIVGSPTLEQEIGRTKAKDVTRFWDIRGFYDWVVNDYVEFSDDIYARAQEIRGLAQASGRAIKSRDSLHIALAEAAGAGFLLTVDTRLERACGVLALKTKVIDPINILQEFAIWALS